MDEKVLKKAMERFDGAIDKFEAKHGERVDELQDRIEGVEAMLATGGSISGKKRREDREITAWETFARTGDPSEMKAHSIAGGASEGEALVPEVIAGQIITKAIAQSALASIVRRTRASTSDYVRLVNLRGQTAAWSSETGTRSETATSMFREVRPTHGGLYSVVGFTRWLAQDSKFDITEMIFRLAADQYQKSIEAAIVSGDGADKPTGMVNSSPTTTGDDDSPARGQDVLQYIAGTADLADDIISLFFSLKPSYRRNAVFVMSSATLAAVRKLRDSNGSGFLWQQNLSSAVDAPDGLLLGKRVITSEELGVVGASPANNAILCGDFDVGYELIEIGPMSIVRDEVTDRGRILLYLEQRFGGRIVDNDAIKVLKA